MRPVPASSSPPLIEDRFETISPALAAALIVADQLRYSHAQLHTNGKDVLYVFADPLQVGEELQRRYTSGVFPFVSAKLLADTRSFLADEAARLRGRHVQK